MHSGYLSLFILTKLKFIATRIMPLHPYKVFPFTCFNTRKALAAKGLRVKEVFHHKRTLKPGLFPRGNQNEINLNDEG